MDTTVEMRMRQLALVAQTAFTLGLAGILTLFGIWASKFQLIGGSDPWTFMQVIAYGVVLAVSVLALLTAALLASASNWPGLRVLSVVALAVVIGEVLVLLLLEGQLTSIFADRKKQTFAFYK